MQVQIFVRPIFNVGIQGQISILLFTFIRFLRGIVTVHRVMSSQLVHVAEVQAHAK